MNRMAVIAGFVAAVLLGLTGGWALRGLVAPDAEQSSQRLTPLKIAPNQNTSTNQSNAHNTSSARASVSGFNFEPGIQSQFSIRHALYEQAHGLDLSQLNQLINRAQGELTQNDYVLATQLLYSRMAEIDAQAAIESIERSDYAGKVRWYDAVFLSFGFQDIEAVLAAAQRLPEEHRKRALAAALLGISNEPYARQLEFARSVGVYPQLQMEGHDPRDVWRDVRAINEPKFHDRQAQATLKLLAQTNPELALELAGDLEPGLQKEISKTIVATWSDDDATAALTWVQDHLGDSQVPVYLTSMLKPLAQQNGELLKATIAQLPDDLRPQLTSLAVRDMIRHDSAGAAAWLADLTAQDELLLNYKSLGRQLGREGLVTVDRWQEKLPREMVLGALPAALRKEAQENPTKAAAYVGNIDDLELQLAAADAVVGEFAKTDPQAAAEWLTQLELPADQSPDAFRSLSTAWAKQDLSSAHTYALQIDEPSSRDQFLGALAFAPEIDVERLEQMQDQATGSIAKIQINERLYRQLSATDPKKAETFRSSNPLLGGAISRANMEKCLDQMLQGG